MPTTALSVLLLTLLLSGTALADFKAGVEAAQRGDFATALSEWTSLAEAGNGAAQYNLGMLYDKGRGVAQDYKQAAHWYRKAADQQFIWAQYAMGSLYEKGEGVEQSFSEAATWYAKAANNSFANAMNSLGRLYETGQGVTQSNVVAYALAKVSSQVDAKPANPANAVLKRLAASLSEPDRKAGDRLSEEMAIRGNLSNALDQFKVK